jgi:SAM-dependent methyltransferase
MEYAVAVSEAADRNKGPILQVIRKEFANTHRVLEIGSGTGQHAVHFASHLPRITWQPTDTGDFLPALRERIRMQGSSNLREAVELDVRVQPWPVDVFDGIFSANTLHIMSWSSVQHFFRGVGRVLGKPGVLCIYGPFRYAGRYTTESNAQFDESLRKRDPESGLREAQEVDALARQQGLVLVADHAMPANNQLIVWKRDA